MALTDHQLTVCGTFHIHSFCDVIHHPEQCIVQFKIFPPQFFIQQPPELTFNFVALTGSPLVARCFHQFCLCRTYHFVVVVQHKVFIHWHPPFDFTYKNCGQPFLWMPAIIILLFTNPVDSH